MYQKTPVISTVAESTIAGRVSAAAERPRTRLPAVFAFLQDSLSRGSFFRASNPACTFDERELKFPSVSPIIELLRHVQR